MDQVPAKVQFQDYVVTNIDFEYLEKPSEPEFSLDINIGHEYFLTDDRRNARVTLTSDIQPDLQDPFFQISVELLGNFKIGIGEVENFEIVDQLLRKNTAAIMFPYLRSTVSNITSVANIPTITIPTYNIAEMLDESDQATPVEE